MRNLVFITCFLLLLFSCATYAQETKVKGNRDPTTEITLVEPFSILEIDSDYEVSIISGAQTQVELTTDSNLHEYISINNVGTKLTISSSARIRSKRKMEFRITFGPELESIVLRENAELSSVTKLNFDKLELVLQDDSKLYLTANVKELNLKAAGDSKSELNLTGTNAKIEISETAKVKSLITYETANITMKDRVDARIEGDVNIGTMSLLDRITIKADNLVFNTLDLSVSHDAKAEVNVKETLQIQADKDSDISVYGSPKIELLKFDDKSVLRKK